MTGRTLLTLLREKGMAVSADRGAVKIAGELAVLTATLRTALQAAKPELLALLAEERLVVADPAAGPSQSEWFAAYGLAQCEQCRRLMSSHHLETGSGGGARCTDQADCLTAWETAATVAQAAHEQEEWAAWEAAAAPRDELTEPMSAPESRHEFGDDLLGLRNLDWAKTQGG